MPPTFSSPRAFRFGVFEADLISGELRKRGMKVKLHAQPFQVLVLLLQRPGEVITRDEMREALWGDDTFVDIEHGVATAISKIRDALDDSADTPRYIETLPRRGYRFIGHVDSVSAEPAAAPVSPDHESDTKTGSEVLAKAPAASSSSPRKKKVALLAGIAVLVLLSAPGMWVFNNYYLRRATGEPINSVRSLAVLPFESLSGDASQDFFADGMTDELITELGQIKALRVISRTSVMRYKRARGSLPRIADDLNVGAVVEGTVLRSGEQVRITAQLIEASTDRHLWAGTFDGTVRDTLAFQSQVARAIADKIEIELTPQEKIELAHVQPTNAEAYEAYLKGRYFWNKRTADGLRTAKGYFEQAIAKDPNYARAYSGLADAYALLGDWEYGVMTTKDALPKAKAAAIRALELDNSLAEAHTSLAFCLRGFEWDYAGAEKEFRRAIELNPGYGTAHHWYAWYLAIRGRSNEAVAEMKKALSTDPLSLIINADLAEVLLIGGHVTEAIEQSRKTVALDPGFPLAHDHLGQAYLQAHRFDEAIQELKEAVRLSNASPTCTADLARAYAATGQKAEAAELLGQLQKRSVNGYSKAPEIASVYAALGDKKQAMAWLEKGVQERFNPGVLVRPAFDPLRNDPDFLSLGRRVGISF